MVVSCSAYGCVNRKTPDNRNLSFHRFPHNKPELCYQWKLAVRRHNWEPTKNSYICSKHFKEEDYIRKAEGDSIRSTLKPDAVPSIFNFSNSLGSFKKVLKIKTEKDFDGIRTNLIKPDALPLILNLKKIKMQEDIVGTRPNTVPKIFKCPSSIQSEERINFQTGPTAKGSANTTPDLKSNAVQNISSLSSSSESEERTDFQTESVTNESAGTGVPFTFIHSNTVELGKRKESQSELEFEKDPKRQKLKQDSAPVLLHSTDSLRSILMNRKSQVKTNNYSFGRLLSHIKQRKINKLRTELAKLKLQYRKLLDENHQQEKLIIHLNNLLNIQKANKTWSL